MINMQGLWKAICGSTFLLMGLIQGTYAAPGIVTVPGKSFQDKTDYSVTGGLNLGQDGFWFANFNAGSAQTLQPVNANNANSLPSWLNVDFTKETSPGVANPSYGFANAANGAYGAVKVAYSDGGQPGYNTLKLPNSTSGLSGQLVDTLDASLGSDTITTRWYFGPGAPSSEYVSIVVDNTGTTIPPGGLTAPDRIRVSNFDHLGNSAQATFGPTLSTNGTADVYTFLLTNIDTVSGANGPGYFAIQLRSSGPAGADLGLAGILFTPVPEPSSVALLAIGLCGIAIAALKKQRRLR